jgi:hypothetical protein
MTEILIAIDDTDNLNSRGTGHCARVLAERLEERGLATVSGITRHQLLVHEDIPYTSHNSAACLSVEAESVDALRDFCGRYLLNASAKGSDAGLCIIEYGRVNEEIIDWGRKAKTRVLRLEDAVLLAKRNDVYLQGFTGTHGGMIGALAATGLRKAGNDGRFLMVKGMRKLMGVMTAEEILRRTGVTDIRCPQGNPPATNSRILLEDWWRPVLQNGKATLIVDQINDNQYHEYRIISKDRLKKLSA